MAITIIATAGSATANSYVTVVEAGAYFATRIGSDIWDDATEEEQKALLVNATRMLDQSYTWNGTIASSTQALRFPRDYVYDCDAELLDSDTIPTAIKNGTCEMLLFVGDTDGGSKDNSIKSAKVGSIEVEYRDNISPKELTNSNTTRAVSCLGTVAVGGGNIKLIKY